MHEFNNGVSQTLSEQPKYSDLDKEFLKNFLIGMLGQLDDILTEEGLFKGWAFTQAAVVAVITELNPLVPVANIKLLADLFHQYVEEAKVLEN